MSTRFTCPYCGERMTLLKHEGSRVGASCLNQQCSMLVMTKHATLTLYELQQALKPLQEHPKKSIGERIARAFLRLLGTQPKAEVRKLRFSKFERAKRKALRKKETTNETLN